MLRPLDGLAIQLSITIPKPEAFAPGFGLVVARMAAAAGPVLRALHRAAYDLDFSSRARHTAAAGLLYMCEPLDFLPLNADRSPEPFWKVPLQWCGTGGQSRRCRKALCFLQSWMRWRRTCRQSFLGRFSTTSTLAMRLPEVHVNFRSGRAPLHHGGLAFSSPCSPNTNKQSDAWRHP